MKPTLPFKYLPLLLFAFLAPFCYGQNKTNLDPAEFEAGIRNLDSVQLLDVRTAAEFKSGHLKMPYWPIGKTSRNFHAA